MPGCARSPGVLPDPNTVDVWCLPIDAGEQALARAWKTLSRDETHQAKAVASEVVRSRQVMRRFWLRQILSEYLATSPGSLEFRYGAFGKPRLAEPGPLHFNLTGGAEHGFLAVATTPVGVDAEPLSWRRAAFIRRWTVAEAVTKAAGCGIGQDLGFEVSWTPAGPLLTRIGHDDPAAWTLNTRVICDSVVTVAVRSPAARWSMRWPATGVVVVP
jgi:phosphopantetheinyl transferase